MTPLNQLTKNLISLVIFTFFMFFILEALFWMQPFVYNLLLKWLNNPTSNLGNELQALVLKKLFINQGFYNLFFAIGGIVGLYLIKKNRTTGYPLVLFVCFASIGAGIVLGLTSKAYILAFLQIVPAAISVYKMLPCITMDKYKSN